MTDRILSVLLDPKVGGLIVMLAGLMLADFAVAVGKAFQADNFQPLFVAEFLRSHVMGRLMPIVALVLLSTVAPPLVVVVGVSVAAYTVETVASIRANLSLDAAAA